MSRPLNLIVLCSLVSLAAVHTALAQKPTLTIPAGHSAWITDYNVSGDGKYLVTASYDNTIKLWDYASRRELVTMFGHDDVVKAVVFSNKNDLIASASWDGTVKFWSVNNGRLIHTWNSPLRKGGSTIQFSPDDSSLLMTTGSICVMYDLRGDSVRWRTELEGRAGKARFFQNGERVAVLDWMPPGQQSMIAVYDANTGAYIEDKSFYYTHGDIRDFVFSPSGRFLFTVVDTDSLNVRIHDMVTGRDSKRLRGHGDHPEFVVAAQNDSILYSIFLDNTPFNARTEIKRWNWYTAKCLDSTVVEHYSRSENFSYEFVPGYNQLIVPQSSMTFGVLDGHSLGSMHQVAGHSHLLNGVVPLRTSLMMVGDDCSVKELDLVRGELNVPVKKPFPDNNFDITEIFKTEDSLVFFYTSRLNEYVQKWKKGSKPATVYQAESLIGKSDYNALTGKLALYTKQTSGHGQLTLIDTSGQVLAKKTLPWRTRNFATSLSFTEDDRVLLGVYNVDSVILWDYRQDILSYIASKKNTGSHWNVLSMNSDKVLLSGLDGLCRILDMRSGRWEHEWRADSTLIHAWNFNSDSSKLIAGIGNGKVRIWNTKNWELVKTLSANKSGVVEVGFTSIENVVYSSGMDNMLHFWNLDSEEILASVTFVDTTEWVVTKAGGLFDASPKAMELIYYVVNDSLDKDEPWKIIQLDQLKHRYYQPGLLPIQLGFNKEPLREVPALETVELAPKIFASIAGSAIKIKLRDQRGGIGPVAIYLNGAELMPDARPASLRNKNTGEIEFVFDLKPYYPRMSTGSSEIKIIAWNQKQWIRSSPHLIQFAKTISSKGAETELISNREQNATRLFGLVVGTSEYAGDDLDLRYAAKDARDFYSALQLAAENLLGRDKVSIALLATDEQDARRKPTKNNVVAQFDAIIPRVKPDDILIVYFSGHGISLSGDNGDFYYVTMQASGSDLSKMNDPAIQKSVGLSSTELTELFNRIAAKKKILILDACNAGKAADMMTASVKDVPASQVRALDRMKDRTGFYILSGSAADAVSYESSVYGQGLLTYALLKAMKGASLRADGAEEYVDVQKLFSYAVDQVPVLSAGIGGIQKPLYRSPGDQRSFDIGKVDDNIKRAIVISEPKPIFIAASFQHPEQLFDVMRLSDAVNSSLREISAKGKQADFLFTEAKAYPGAYRVSGNYKEDADRLVLNYVITRDMKIVGKPRVFQCKNGDANSIAQLFVEQLKRDFEASVN